MRNSAEQPRAEQRRTPCELLAQGGSDFPGKVQVLSEGRALPTPWTLGAQGPRSLNSPRGQRVAVLPTPTGSSRSPPAGDSQRRGFLQVHVEATLPAMPRVARNPEAERKAGPSSMGATSQPPRVPSGQSGKQLLGCLSEHGVGGTAPLQPLKLPVRETGALDHGGA
ncbi:unnamed protein product [Rangifer tarandus platyrhynchus]|uniref:Uncharacterized protein n=2 Tax=Rangifer tarandus platyrhynchus TaxID=3082113 RepID=A0ACB0FM61_RANTA|nr:unnamed protein product [Rangifer tarandus platyrhynchus]CAI9714060.1 unnamed protein product [Rangifer tarandus platyrhynchus]